MRRRLRPLVASPIDGGRVRVLEDLPRTPSNGSRPTITGFDWSANGRRIALLMRENPPGSFVIENPLADARARSTSSAKANIEDITPRSRRTATPSSRRA
jgi:hypothetical protein